MGPFAICSHPCSYLFNLSSPDSPASQPFCSREANLLSVAPKDWLDIVWLLSSMLPFLCEYMFIIFRKILLRLKGSRQLSLMNSLLIPFFPSFSELMFSAYTA